MLKERCAEASAYANTLSWVRGADIVINIDCVELACSPETPAWWDPRERTVHVNVAAIYSRRSDQLEALDSFITELATPQMATMRGMLRHEIAHSRWSTWDLAGLARRDQSLYRIAEIFEEVRIETRLRNINNEATKDLRASFRWILARMDAGAITSRLSVGHAWCLIVGRYLSGIASLEEVEPVDELARSVLGDSTVEEMVDILGGAVSLRKDDVLDAMMPVYARRWLDLLDPDGAEHTPEGGTVLHAEGAPVHGASPEDGEDDEGGEDGEGGEDSTADGHGRTEASDIADLARDAVRQVEENVSTTKVRDIDMADPSVLAQEVFGARRETSRYVYPMPPSPQLQQRARRMAEIFEQLSLPSVTLTTLPSEIPPGRLRSREMVRKSAEQSQGLMSTSTPWERKKRRHSHTRPVVVGIMTDVSGSMRWAEEVSASFSWMLATAGVRVGARTASVTFGEDVEAVVAPGEIPRQVMVRAANGGEEAFDRAAAALDGVLRFSTQNQAAKVLFVFSDGYLVRMNEMARAHRRLEEFTKAGTIVVWVEPDEAAWNALKPTKNATAIKVRHSRSDDTEEILQQVENELLRAIRSTIRS